MPLTYSSALSLSEVAVDAVNSRESFKMWYIKRLSRES